MKLVEEIEVRMGHLDPAGPDHDMLVRVLDALAILEQDQAKLHALEAGGVDNWEWYSESLKDWYKKYYPEDFE